MSELQQDYIDKLEGQVRELRQRIADEKLCHAETREQLAASQESERAMSVHTVTLTKELADLQAACDSTCYARDQAYVRIEELKFQLEEQTNRHLLRIAELAATIRSHGIPVKTFSGGEAHYCTAKETLLDAHAKQVESEDVPCNPDPRAPHGFCRDASHSAGYYVCECHGWEPK